MNDADQALPVELRVDRLLRERVPHLQWDTRRVVWAVRDFKDVIDTERVAKRCADWLAGPDARRVKDGAAQLRRYFEKEQDQSAPNVTSLQARLRAYNTPDVVTGPSIATPSSPGASSQPRP